MPRIPPIPVSSSPGSSAVTLRERFPMIELRLFDPNRRPTSWTEIIRPGQCAAFSKRGATGASCDQRGDLFETVEKATCLLFDGLEAARTFCEEQVRRAPDVLFEVFDSSGRGDGPLLVIVHPSRSGALEGNPRGMRIRAWAAAGLLVASAALFWIDYRHDQGMLVFPTLLGINLVVVAARLLQLNGSYAHAARARDRRVSEHLRAEADRGGR